MGKTIVKIKFINNLNSAEMLNEVLWLVSDTFEFVVSETPNFLVFGPYGPPPPPGDYVRVGYFCEYMWPNMSVCDWAFGVPYAEEVDSERYCRIEWHGIRPQQLVKDITKIQAQPIPPRFCNFIFSNRVGLREGFFSELSRYKHIDAPGKSMNNQSSLDADYPDEDRWVRKRKFLSLYKFTIAFENNSALGYNTEKLTDPIMAGSLPIYFGNPQIGRHFNTRSFINAHDYLPSRRHIATRWVEELSRVKYARADRVPMKIQPRFRKAMRILKHRLEYGFDFSKLVARIIEVDQDDSLYRAMRAEPVVPDNLPPSVDRVRNQWIKIFSLGKPSHAATC
jgi:hypothetical protein